MTIATQAQASVFYKAAAAAQKAVEATGLGEYQVDFALRFAKKGEASIALSLEQGEVYIRKVEGDEVKDYVVFINLGDFAKAHNLFV